MKKGFPQQSLIKLLYKHFPYFLPLFSWHKKPDTKDWSVPGFIKWGDMRFIFREAGLPQRYMLSGLFLCSQAELLLCGLHWHQLRNTRLCLRIHRTGHGLNEAGIIFSALSSLVPPPFIHYTNSTFISPMPLSRYTLYLASSGSFSPTIFTPSSSPLNL